MERAASAEMHTAWAMGYGFPPRHSEWPNEASDGFSSSGRWSLYDPSQEQNPVSSTIYRPLSITLDKLDFRPRVEESFQYALHLETVPGGPKTTIVGVHLSERLRTAIEAGGVQALCVHRFQLNGLAQRALPADPECTVTGVSFSDGTVLREVPPVLTAARHRLFIQAAVAALVGVASTVVAGPKTAVALGCSSMLACAFFAWLALSLPAVPSGQSLR